MSTALIRYTVCMLIEGRVLTFIHALTNCIDCIADKFA